jgi:hypothetical protein
LISVAAVSFSRTGNTEMVDGRKRKAGSGEALTKRYGKIGISAVAAAAPYQSTHEKNDAEKPSKNAPKKEAEKAAFRGTSSRR